MKEQTRFSQRELARTHSELKPKLNQCGNSEVFIPEGMTKQEVRLCHFFKELYDQTYLSKTYINCRVLTYKHHVSHAVVTLLGKKKIVDTLKAKGTRWISPTEPNIIMAKAIIEALKTEEVYQSKKDNVSLQETNLVSSQGGVSNQEKTKEIVNLDYYENKIYNFLIDVYQNSLNRSAAIPLCAVIKNHKLSGIVSTVLGKSGIIISAPKGRSGAKYKWNREEPNYEMVLEFVKQRRELNSEYVKNKKSKKIGFFKRLGKAIHIIIFGK